MDFTWLALSVGFLAMLVVTYLAHSIGKQEAGTLQKDTSADCFEARGKTIGKLECNLVLLEFLNEVSCLRSSLAL